MNEYQKLVAYMKILVQNLMTLHRNLRKDAAWFGNHKQIGKWYETMSEQVDDLAEMGIALGYREPSISDAVLTYSSAVLSTEPRELTESYRRAYAGSGSSCTRERAEPAPGVRILLEQRSQL